MRPQKPNRGLDVEGQDVLRRAAVEHHPAGAFGERVEHRAGQLALESFQRAHRRAEIAAADVAQVVDGSEKTGQGFKFSPACISVATGL